MVFGQLFWGLRLLIFLAPGQPGAAVL